MKKLLSTLFAITMLSLVGCNHKIFEEQHAVENENWQRFEPQVFDFTVRNIDDCYNIDMTIKVDTTLFRDADFPLVVNLTNDEGEHRMFYSYIPLRTAGHNVSHKTEGNYVIVRSHVKEYFYFNLAGNYHLEVKQGTPKYDLPGVAYFGVTVEKSDLKIK